MSFRPTSSHWVVKDWPKGSTWYALRTIAHLNLLTS